MAATQTALDAAISRISDLETRATADEAALAAANAHLEDYKVEVDV